MTELRKPAVVLISAVCFALALAIFTPVQAEASNVVRELEQSFVDIAEKAKPSVVHLASEKYPFKGMKEELNERDFDALRNFLKSKRVMDLTDKTCNLAISGDVRTEWRHLNETCKGQNMRGGNATNRAGLPISRNDFDIEAPVA